MSNTVTPCSAGELYSPCGWISPGSAHAGMRLSRCSTPFLVSHWIFRWRTAMNDYYMSNWHRLRHIEGASQRVQEDTMRFSHDHGRPRRILHRFDMTLIAFMPVLTRPVDPRNRTADRRRNSLFACRRGGSWSIFGTVVCSWWPASSCRAWSSRTSVSKPPTARNSSMAKTTPRARSRRRSPNSFPNVRHNYFRLYFHYVYFNVVRYSYLQANNIFSALDSRIPSIVGRHRSRSAYAQSD